MAQSKLSDEGAHDGVIKTLTIRDVAPTAAYTCDESLKTLEEIVEYYDRGGNHNPYLDQNYGHCALLGGERQHP